jgi:hypothetical protein
MTPRSFVGGYHYFEGMYARHFYPEDGGYTFFRKVGTHLQGYMAS